MFGAVGLLIMHFAARHGLDSDPPPDAVCSSSARFFLLVAVLGVGSERQRRQPLDRLRLPADPALGAGQGGAGPLRRRPARRQAEAGAQRSQGLMPFLLVAGAACLLIVVEPDMGTAMVIAFAAGATLIAAGARPRDLGLIALRARRRGPAPDARRALPDGAPDRLPQSRLRLRAAPASRRPRRRSRSARGASSGSGSATACRRPSTSPRPTPT